MYDVLDQSSEVYKLLNTAEVKAVISGGVYLETRPLNSRKEDIIVNSVNLNDGTAQRGTVNVNVYVPDKIIQANGENYAIQDTARIRAISRVIKPLIEETHLDHCSIWIAGSSTFADESSESHFLNFRLKTNFFNLVN